MPYCTVNSIQLYYELHGPPDGFPVVFINGLLSDTTSWVFQVPAFTEHFRVLIYDCRGQGRSDKPAGPYSQHIHADDLRGLLQELHLRHVHLVGLSNGGTIAMCFALGSPEYVRRMVLVDTFAYADEVMQSKLQSWLAAIDAGGALLRFDVATPWVWGRNFLRQYPQVLQDLRARTADSPVAVRTLIEGTLQYDIRERLPQIRVPTLVLVGEEDVLTPPWYSRELAEQIPGARLMVLPQVGHAPTIEAPELFNSEALAFLRE